jgi:hypothetical protein
MVIGQFFTVKCVSQILVAVLVDEKPIAPVVVWVK